MAECSQHEQDSSSTGSVLKAPFECPPRRAPQNLDHKRRSAGDSAKETELKALRESVGSLRKALEAEVARATKAEAAAKQARSGTKALQARVASLSKELLKAQTDAKEARSRNEVLQAKLSALESVTAETERQSKQRVGALKESLQGFREADEQCKKEGKRFSYVLASNGQEGSIPWSVLASDPESLLYKMYCG